MDRVGVVIGTRGEGEAVGREAGGGEHAWGDGVAVGREVVVGRGVVAGRHGAAGMIGEIFKGGRGTRVGAGGGGPADLDKVWKGKVVSLKITCLAT